MTVMLIHSRWIRERRKDMRGILTRERDPRNAARTARGGRRGRGGLRMRGQGIGYGLPAVVVRHALGNGRRRSIGLQAEPDKLGVHGVTGEQMVGILANHPDLVR